MMAQGSNAEETECRERKQKRKPSITFYLLVSAVGQTGSQPCRNQHSQGIPAIPLANVSLKGIDSSLVVSFM